MSESAASRDLSSTVRVLERAYLQSPDGVGDPEVAAAAHLALGLDRLAGTATTRVYRADDAVGAAVQIVTDDMPLLVESVTALLSRLGAAVAALVHPVFAVHRDLDGVLLDLAPDGALQSDEPTESWIHIQLHPTTPPDVLDGIECEIDGVLDDVRQVVADTDAMHTLQNRLADELEALAATRLPSTRRPISPRPPSC